MASDMQNPGVQAGASRNQLVGWLHPFPTVSERQAQMLARRFCLSDSTAQTVARLCFGERRHD